MADTMTPSWAGYWAGFDGRSAPADASAAWMRGFHAGRVDAGRERTSVAQGVAMMAQAYDRIMRGRA
jgi:hypothetical protein